MRAGKLVDWGIEPDSEFIDKSLRKQMWRGERELQIHLMNSSHFVER